LGPRARRARSRCGLPENCAAAWRKIDALDRAISAAVASTPTPTLDKRVQTFLLGYPGVTAVRQLIVTFIGPSQLWVIARLDIDDNLRGDQVKSLVSGIEPALKVQSKDIYRVDVVPIGGPDGASSCTSTPKKISSAGTGRLMK
jgi:hypothetical protein